MSLLLISDNQSGLIVSNFGLFSLQSLLIKKEDEPFWVSLIRYRKAPSFLTQEVLGIRKRRRTKPKFCNHEKKSKNKLFYFTIQRFHPIDLPANLITFKELLSVKKFVLDADLLFVIADPAFF